MAKNKKDKQTNNSTEDTTRKLKTKQHEPHYLKDSFTDM